MYEVGDKVFYPMHGACVIKGIEEKEILEQKQHFFILELPAQSMKIMLARDKVDQIGIRRVVNEQTIDLVLSQLEQGDTDFTINANLRHRSNLSKIKTGDIHQGAEVIRDLMRINRKKGLPLGDQNMLTNARDFLISEIMLSLDVSKEQATTLIDRPFETELEL